MPEEEIALESPDGFEIKAGGETVSGARLDPVAGASSPAPASSGIPSAVRQQSIHAGKDLKDEPARTEATPMPDRTIPMHQDTKP